MKSWLEENDKEMYSTHNEGKYVVAERFIRILKIEFRNTWLQYQKMFIFINQKTVNKYNNIYHGTIKMKPVDVKSSTYINSSKEINNEDPKFKTGGIVRILIFLGYC